MFQDVEQVATVDVEDDILEPDAAFFLSFAFFASSQAKYFTRSRDITAVCLLGTHWRRLECAQECARTRSRTGHPAANANQGTK
jgi:hypothetical protein